MPFEADSQDSRDPNSPQWGYAKVKKEEKLKYPAKDKSWNKYVLFVHDQDNLKLPGDVLNDKKAIKVGKTLDCVMVPAKLTIDKETIDNLLQKAISSGDNELIKRLQEAQDVLSQDKIEIPSSEINVDSNQAGANVGSTLWVALVRGVQ